MSYLFCNRVASKIIWQTKDHVLGLTRARDTSSRKLCLPDSLLFLILLCDTWIDKPQYSLIAIISSLASLDVFTYASLESSKSMSLDVLRT